MRSRATPAVLGATLGAAALALWALWTRRTGVARAAAAGFAVLLIAGWAVAQYPTLIEPDLTIAEAARPARAVLPAVLWSLGIGAVVLVPSLVLLFALFKRGPRAAPPERAPDV
jgi:cytochrome d ubiquinol oxidase subunit II